MEYIGIDFGMRNIKAAYYNGVNVLPVDLIRKQGARTQVMPNVVFYQENEENELKKYFGLSEEAEYAFLNQNPDYIMYIKRELQKEKWEKSVCGGKYTFTAEDIAADIFSYVAEQVEHFVRKNDVPTVITVPVIFSEVQKNKLKRCAEKAGLNVSEIVSEPFAAMFAPDIINEYSDDDGENYALIFDFGGYTLDMCVFCIDGDDEAKDIRLMSSAGMKFGGVDITKMIADNIRPELSTGIQSLKDDGFEDEQIESILVQRAEEIKTELYADNDGFMVETAVAGQEISVSRERIDKLFQEAGIKQRIFDMLDDMFESIDDGIDKSDISYIHAVGGTSRISYFQDILHEYFGKRPDEDLLEDDNYVYNSVAMGAANYPAESDSMTVVNSVPMSFYIDRGKGAEIALRRNTSYSEKGKSMLIDRKVLCEKNWHIKVYQSLCDKKRADTAGDDMYYAGFFKADKTLYPENADIYISVFQNEQGLNAETKIKDSKNEFEIVEKIKLTAEELYV